MCSKTNACILWKTSKNDFDNFSLTELVNHLKDKQVAQDLQNIHHLAADRRQTACLENLLRLLEANSSSLTLSEIN